LGKSVTEQTFMKTILGVILLTFILLVLTVALVTILKFVFVIGFLIALAVTGLIAFSFFRSLLTGGKGDKSRESALTHKLHCQEGPVRLYADEPSVNALIDRSKNDSCDRVIQMVDSNTDVSIVEESEIAVKIKVKAGPHKGLVGWTDKANVLSTSR
ncbi:MAG: hypothetical protein K8F91_20260, partial [Candidatus Obscuribacterales bacterium]|nr:hypothetical protein [Candidatus Obscuribacterales bacterium]